MKNVSATRIKSTSSQSRNHGDLLRGLSVAARQRIADDTNAQDILIAIETVLVTDGAPASARDAREIMATIRVAADAAGRLDEQLTEIRTRLLSIDAAGDPDVARDTLQTLIKGLAANPDAAGRITDVVDRATTARRRLDRYETDTILTCVQGYPGYLDTQFSTADELEESIQAAADRVAMIAAAQDRTVMTSRYSAAQIGRYETTEQALTHILAVYEQHLPDLDAAFAEAGVVRMLIAAAQPAQSDARRLAEKALSTAKAEKGAAAKTAKTANSNVVQLPLGKVRSGKGGRSQIER